MGHCLFFLAVMAITGGTAQQASEHPIKIVAVGKGVKVEIDGLSATASRARYDSDSGQLVLEGSSDSPVTLTQSSENMSSELRAQKIEFSLKSGKLHALGIRQLKTSP